MRWFSTVLSLIALLASPTTAQEAAERVTPNDIIVAAAASEWVPVRPSDLMVIQLAPGGAGRRRVVVQLMPAPFSQGWIENIRRLVKARWYDGIAVVRVQGNYVVQWGDPDSEVPDKAKALPEGLEGVPESDYVAAYADLNPTRIEVPIADDPGGPANRPTARGPYVYVRLLDRPLPRDSYASFTGHSDTGWPVALEAVMDL